LNLSEILPVYLVDRLYLLFAVTGDKYCIFGRLLRAVENELLDVQNLPRWAAEFGKLARGN